MSKTILFFLFDQKEKEMPPKILQEKSYVKMYNLRYSDSGSEDTEAGGSTESDDDTEA